MLAEQWEIFTHSSLYIDAYKGAEAKAAAEAAPPRVFDRPYRGWEGGAKGAAPLSTWDDTYQPGKKGQYPGQYLESYKGSSNSYALGQGQGQGWGLGQGYDCGYAKQSNPLAAQNPRLQDLTAISTPLAKLVITGSSKTQINPLYRPEALSHLNAYPYQQVPLPVQAHGHAVGQSA